MTRRTAARILLTVGAPLWAAGLVTMLFWAAGYDFDERGGAAALYTCLVGSLVTLLPLFVWFAPHWKD